MPITISEADLSLARDADAVLALLDAYSRDPMGDGAPLPESVKAALIPGLRAHPTTLVLLAWDGDAPVGIATCFLGFSTFKAKPLLNIHDLAVLPERRGEGIGPRLLDAAAEAARARGCCKLTLEVLENNRRARKVYEAAGFSQATYQDEAGGALFYAKPL